MCPQSSFSLADHTPECPCFPSATWCQGREHGGGGETAILMTTVKSPHLGLPGGSVVKNPPATKAADVNCSFRCLFGSRASLLPHPLPLSTGPSGREFVREPNPPDKTNQASPQTGDQNNKARLRNPDSGKEATQSLSPGQGAVKLGQACGSEPAWPGLFLYCLGGGG